MKSNLFVTLSTGGVGIQTSDHTGMDSHGNMFVQTSPHSAVNLTTGQVTVVHTWDDGHKEGKR